jgi:transposase-like protein
METKLFDLLQKIQNVEPHKYAIESQLIEFKPQIFCHKCKYIMYFKHDDFTYRCMNNRCKTSRNLFFNLGLTFHKISLTSILQILVCFCYDITIHDVLKILNVSEFSIQHYYDIFREKICLLYKKEFDQYKFDIAEIDESLFGKRKYHRGRLIKNQWILGICDAENGGRLYMEKVENRKRETLEPIILHATNEESVIFSDKWAAYDDLENQNRFHLTVNHSENFVDPETEVNTQRIESLWNCCKLWLKSHNYKCHSKLEQYLYEYCYRYNHGKSFSFIWEHIGK